jgi:hypothetical protein
MQEYKADELLIIDVDSLVKKRDGFDYLPWAVAWRKIIELDSGATFEVERAPNGIPCFGSPEMGWIVYTSLTFRGFTRKMHLPVLNRDKAIKNPNMFQVNTAVMRCLVKNIAMFGLGLDVYIGEYVPKKELEAYDQDGVEIDMSKDPFDGPGIDGKDLPTIESDSSDIIVEGNKPKKAVGKKQVPNYQQDFIDAVNATEHFTAKKKKDLISDETIGKLTKQAFVKTGEGL